MIVPRGDLTGIMTEIDGKTGGGRRGAGATMNTGADTTGEHLGPG
jgi:hypothetical protein